MIARISYPHVEKDEIFDLPGIVSRILLYGRMASITPYLTSLLKEMSTEGATPTHKGGA
jgi:manganese-dependent inorganic pyrophosphatase